MKFDSNQRKAIDSRVNTVVTAGAGAGKTRVLTERYLELLREEGIGVENILTLTFTKKAAAEMYERIYSELSQRSSEPALMKHLDTFDQAYISTLDSFCNGIVKNSIHTYGIPAEFSMDEQAFQEKVSNAALDFYFDHMDNPALLELVSLHGFKHNWENFLVSFAVEECTLTGSGDYQADLERQHTELKRQFRSTSEQLSSLAALFRDVDAGGRTGEAVEKAVTGFLRLMDSHDPETPEDFRKFAEEFGALLPVFKFRKPSGKAEALQILKDHHEEWKDGLFSLHGIALTVASREKQCELFALAGEWRDIVISLKRETGILTFSDIVSLSVDILKNDLPLREHYKKQFRYIMIDEFQDNNLQQKELLYLLSERDDECLPGIPEADRLHPGKLFFVGDEKQSIYRFRGADVSVFKQLQDELTTAGGTVVTLDTNYRSEPGLITFFNDLFPGIIGHDGEEYEADFQPLSGREPSQGLRNKPQIEFWLKPYDEEADLKGDEVEAFRIAEYIKNTVDNKLLAVGDGRPAEFKDFAILMKSTSSQSLYENMLRDFGVPFTTLGTRSLFLKAPVFDVYNLLAYALNPDDLLAGASLLRSPFCGISDEYVAELLLREKEDISTGLISLQSAAIFSELSDAEQKNAYTETVYLLDQLRTKIDTVPLSEVLDQIWNTRGYVYEILSRPKLHNYTDFYLYLTDIARTYDSQNKNCAEFLLFLQENLSKYEKIDDYRILQEAAGVQLLTVHKSKGLEFPIVILANSGNSGRGDMATPWFRHREWGLSINFLENPASGGSKYLNYFYQDSKERNEQETIAEQKRLLYVACTRAENHLVISGRDTRNNRNIENSKGVFLNMVKPFMDSKSETPVSDGYTLRFRELKDFEEHLLIQMRRTKSPDLAAMAEHYKAKVQITGYADDLEISATVLEEEFGTRGELLKTLLPLSIDTYLSDERLQTAFGTLCHKVLELKLGNIPISAAEPELAAFKEKYRSEVMEEALRLAETFLLSELGKRALQADFLFLEKPFLYKLPLAESTAFISGIADLYFRDSHGSVLVDFKTDGQIFTNAYQLQQSLYVHAFKELEQNRPEIFLFYLRSGETRPVDVLEPDEIGKIITERSSDSE